MRLIIVGSGGHAGVVVEAARKIAMWAIEGLLDETVTHGGYRHGQLLLDRKVVFQNSGAYKFFVAIGDNHVREKLSLTPGMSFVNIFHPRSYQADKVLSEGSFFAVNSVVGYNSHVGNFCIVNTGAILDHDSTLGNYSHLCPGVVTGGHVKIGSRTTVGLGAIIRDRVTIGDNCVIGMGSVVLKDVPDNTTGWGNPFAARNLDGSVFL